jgi:hypothetical protein
MTDHPIPLPRRFIGPERRAEIAEELRQNAIVWEAIKASTSDPNAFLCGVLKKSTPHSERRFKSEVQQCSIDDMAE